MSVKRIITALALLTALTACSSNEEAATDTEERVSANLCFALSKSETTATRQGSDIVQAEGTAFRGIAHSYLIPFTANGKVESTDMPKFYMPGSASSEYNRNGSYFYLSTGCMFQPGINAFLFYGQANPKTAASDAENGALQVAIPAGNAPADISFSLKNIYQDGLTLPEGGLAIARYLNNIADAQTVTGGATVSWRNCTQPVLKTLFSNFTGQDIAGNASVMGGSSANARKHAAALKEALEGADFSGDDVAAAIRDEIISRIDNVSNLPAQDYPASAGLPDGAAVLLWTGDGFVPQVETSTKAAINSINRYCFPAELYYYANSLIKTSNLDDRSSYYPSATTWDDVLSCYEYDNAAISSNTRAIVVKDPAQYAVARLQVKLKQAAATLKDSRGTNVNISVGAFPLTGIVVGGQHTVGFDFKPLDTPDRLIYDSQVKTDAGNYISLSTTEGESAATHTLVLQSEENDKEVNVILEFQNNSGQDFRGVNDGIIYQGTKFYLIGSVKRPTQTESSKGYEKQVFTQDYTTTLSITVSSFAKAYNVLPDVLAPRLEVGIELTPQWVQASTTTIIL